MPETVSSDDVGKMLHDAKFPLRGFEAEHLKVLGRDPFVMDAFLIACLHGEDCLLHPHKLGQEPVCQQGTEMENGRTTWTEV